MLLAMTMTATNRIRSVFILGNDLRNRGTTCRAKLTETGEKSESDPFARHHGPVTWVHHETTQSRNAIKMEPIPVINSANAPRAPSRLPANCINNTPARTNERRTATRKSAQSSCGFTMAGYAEPH